MSGGHFDYQQYNIGYIADSIQSIIDQENDYAFSSKTFDEFRNAVTILRMAEIFAIRVDWLLSGDDGEETFHRRLREDIEKALT